MDKNRLEMKVNRLEETIRSKTEALANFGDLDQNVRTLTKIFRFFDVDNTGFVNFSGFCAAMTKGNFGGMHHEVECLFNRYDEDYTGLVDYLDFACCIFGVGSRKALTPIQQDVINKINKQMIRKSGIAGIFTLSKYLRALQQTTDDGINVIHGHDLANAARKFISVSTRELESLFEINSMVNLDEFLSQLKRGMSVARKELVQSVFRRLDSQGRGYVTMHDIESHYQNSTASSKQNVMCIPVGETTRNMLNNFIDPSEGGADPPHVEIPWLTFLDYYRCISLAVDRDADFELLVRNSWRFETKSPLSSATSPTNGVSHSPHSHINNKHNGNINNGSKPPPPSSLVRNNTGLSAAESSLFNSARSPRSHDNNQWRGEDGAQNNIPVRVPFADSVNINHTNDIGGANNPRGTGRLGVLEEDNDNGMLADTWNSTGGLNSLSNTYLREHIGNHDHLEPSSPNGGNETQGIKFYNSSSQHPIHNHNYHHGSNNRQTGRIDGGGFPGSSLRNTTHDTPQSRPGTAETGRFYTTTTHMDYTRHSRPQTGNRMTRRDGNYTSSRARAEYVDGRNGYLQDPRLYGLPAELGGGIDHISPRLTLGAKQDGWPKQTITATDFTKKEPVVMESHFASTRPTFGTYNNTSHTYEFENPDNFDNNDNNNGGGFPQNHSPLIVGCTLFYNDGTGGLSPEKKLMRPMSGARPTTATSTLPQIGANINRNRTVKLPNHSSAYLRDTRTTGGQDYPTYNRPPHGIIHGTDNVERVYTRVTSGLKTVRRKGYAGVNVPTTGGAKSSKNGVSHEGKEADDHNHNHNQRLIRRVLVTHTDGSEEVVDIVDELGNLHYDSQTLLQRLTELGVTDISDVRL